MNKYKVAILISVSLSLLSAAGEKEKVNKENKEMVTYSTNMDFDSTLIDGQMKAPSGFFLQGRNKQSLSNMVKLRSNFKRELVNSKTAVKAMVR
ncbi:MAG: hypothetical protein HQK54_02680 [Oligoflexales bacterium]|nr:hypothetical protein [Oligoflexales bacterium]